MRIIIVCRIVLLIICIFFPILNGFEWDSFIKSYQMFHDMNAIKNDPNICDRNFVIGTYACPSMVGNHLHEFMNAFAGALITNRTILWSFCTRKPCLTDDEETCGLYLKRSPWIAHYKEVLDIWKSKGCDSKRKAKSQVCNDYIISDDSFFKLFIIFILTQIISTHYTYVRLSSFVTDLPLKKFFVVAI